MSNKTLIFGGGGWSIEIKVERVEISVLFGGR